MLNPLKLIQPTVPFPQIGRADTALLVIDVTYKDAHPDYGLGPRLLERGLHDIHREYYARIDRVIERIQRLREAAIGNQMEIISIKVAAATLDCRDMVRNFRQRNVWAPFGSIEGDIREEVRPAPGEIVIAKTSTSAFNSTNIDVVLRNLGIENLIAVGCVTNGCVELTVRDGADRGYNVILVSDATTALTLELHENALDRMSSAMSIATTEEVLAQIRGAALALSS